MQPLTINDYPTKTFSQRWINKNDAIDWIFCGTWSDIDNFALFPVVYKDFKYATSEHAYAAAKAATVVAHDYIAAASNPGVAKHRGRACALRIDWDQIKFQVMWNILVCKFDQNPKARQTLLATGKRPIIEGNHWADDIWGAVYRKMAGAPNRVELVGRNALGFQLMALRAQLKG